MEHYQKSMKDMLMAPPSTATSIDIFSDGVIQSVKDGELNPLSVIIQLKAMETASERIRKETKSELMTEVSKYPENKFTFNGNEITKAEHGTKYDFSKCGDPEWEMLDQQRQSIANQLKERETFLKAIRTPLEVFNSLTGEVSFIIPPTKTSVSGINISIK